MKLGATQRLVLENVAASQAPYAGHKSHAEYTRRMDVARQLEKRGLLAVLPFGHPRITDLASMYRLTEAGYAALGGDAAPIRSKPIHSTRNKSGRASLDRDIAHALKKPAMTVKRADEIIRTADLEGFSGRCGRVAIAINRVLFNNEGRYVIATNPWINEYESREYMGHVVVEWKGRLFDATGVIDDPETIRSWGMIDRSELEELGLEFLTDKQITDDAELRYLDEFYSSRDLQEKIIQRQTGGQGQCPLRDVERALREAMT